MVPCTHCGQITDATEKPKCCAKCRSVTYCNADCQKANWEAHKITCKPCSFYSVEKILTLHSSQQWRKLIKWRPYIDQLFVEMRRVDDPHITTQLLKLHYMFVSAYKLGITTTDDPDNEYAKASVSLLNEMIELQGKLNLFPDQGSSLCDLALMTKRIVGPHSVASVEFFKRATTIAVQHRVPKLHARASLGIGISCNNALLYEEAAKVFRIALDAAAIDHDEFEVCCCHHLIEVLFEINSIDEAETFIRRFPVLIRQAIGPDFRGLTPFHLKYHLHLARVCDARGQTAKVEQELRKIISLVNDNKSCIHDWRPVFLLFLEQCNKKLKILDPKTGEKGLIKSFADLAMVKA